MMQTFGDSSEVSRVGWKPADSAVGNNSDWGKQVEDEEKQLQSPKVSIRGNRRRHGEEILW